MSTVARVCRNHAVLAVSSGDEVVTDQSFLSLFQWFSPLNFLPFTEKEASYFVRYHKLEFTADELIPLTGYNPFLLSLASKRTNLPGVI